MLHADGNDSGRVVKAIRNLLFSWRNIAISLIDNSYAERFQSFSSRIGRFFATGKMYLERVTKSDASDDAYTHDIWRDRVGIVDCNVSPSLSV